jgi:signal transduction histidine kinase
MTRLWPRSLPGWILLIVVLAMALAQIATLVNVNQEVARANRSTDLFSLGERTLVLARELQNKPADQREAFLQNLRGPTFSGEFDGKPAIASVVAADDELAEMEDLLMARISTEGILDLRIERSAPSSAGTAAATPEQQAGSAAGDVARRIEDISRGFAASGRFTVAMQLADKTWFNFSLPMSPAPTLLTGEGVPVYLAILAIIIVLSLWAVIQLTAPYRRLERAVTKISGDLNTPPLMESGSREARATIRAVNIMQSRLRDYVADRENLAAALAHDLRTPLTRMKLRCELMRASKDKTQLQSDIAELEAIVASVIDFASVGRSDEEPSRVDVVSLLKTVCDDFPKARLAPESEAIHRLVIAAHPVQLSRCVRNLVENAIRYAGSATVAVADQADSIAISVDDKGPGIPHDKLEDVTKPFVRLETSRNQAFGGTGLGLAIAASIARTHGGVLRLENRDGGGLRATVTLPKAGTPPIPV